MIDTLQDTLMKDLGLNELPEDERAVLAEEIAGVVFQGTMLRVFEVLSEAQQEELGKLFEASTASPEDVAKHDAILGFLKANVPNLDEIVAGEIAALKTDYTELGSSTPK